MKIDLNNQKGITLIVLVITIIVMIILATISINYGLKSVDSAQDDILQANIQMVQQKITEDYIKDKMNGNKKDYLGMALTYDEVQEIKGSETIALQKLTSRAEYNNGNPYYKLTTEVLRNMGIEVPDDQEYLIDYDNGEIWDITNIKYKNDEDYVYLGGITNQLETEAESNVDSPITISLEEDLNLVDDKYVLKIRVKDTSGKIASNAWGVAAFSTRKTSIRNSLGDEVAASDVEEFTQTEITSASDTDGEYIYTIRFPRPALNRFNLNQELIITIKKGSIIDYNGNTNATTLLTTAYVGEIAPGGIDWGISMDNYSTKIPGKNGGYVDENGKTWGTEATVKLTLYASTGLKHMDYIFKYYWSPDGSAPTNFDAVASEVLLNPDEGKTSVATTIYLNAGTGRGKLYVKPKEGYTGINTGTLDMGYKTIDVYLDNTSPATQENKLVDLDFWGLYNSTYFKPNMGTIIETDRIYNLKVKDNETGIKPMSDGTALWTLDGINKSDFGSDILKNDNKLLEFFSDDFSEGGISYGGINEQLAAHSKYLDLSGMFLYGDRTSGYYYLYKLQCYERGNGDNLTLCDNVGNEIELPIKQGPFNIDGNQPDIDSVYIDKNLGVGKITMIDDYSGVASGKSSDAQKNINNFKNIKYRWVPENDPVLTNGAIDMVDIVRTYRGNPAKQDSELTLVNTDANHLVYSQKNDFDNYTYATITVDPPTTPGKYKLFVYAADFEDVAENILLDYFTVSETGGQASSHYTSAGANDAEDAGRFSDDFIVIEAEATDIHVDVVEQSQLGYPTSFNINLSSPSKGKFEVKRVSILRTVNVKGSFETKEEFVNTPPISVPGNATQPYTITWSSTSNGPIKVKVVDKYDNEYFSDEVVLQNSQATILTLNVKAGERYTIPIGNSNSIRYVEFGNRGEYQLSKHYYSFLSGVNGDITVKISGEDAIIGFDLIMSNLIPQTGDDDKDFRNYTPTANSTNKDDEDNVYNFQKAITEVKQFGIHATNPEPDSDQSMHYLQLYRKCSNLKKLPDLSTMSYNDREQNKKAFKGMESCYRAFEGTAITNFDSQFFEYAGSSMDFNATFKSCKNLEYIDEDLFKKAGNATSISYTFDNSGLKSIPEKLFEKNTKVTKFIATFQNSAITSIPTQLFTKNTKVEDFTATFRDTAVQTIPETLFKTNTLAKNFDATFQRTNVRSLSAKLFEKNTEALFFGYTFGGTKVSSIPSNMFEKNIKAERFNFTFEYTQVTTLSEKLFEKNIDVLDFNGTFNETPLESIPENLFKTNKKALQFYQTFRATKITEIPQTLFWENTDAREFRETFAGCDELKNTESEQNIPVNLFLKNPKVGDSTAVRAPFSTNKYTPTKGFDGLFWGDKQVEYISKDFFNGQKNKGCNISYGSTFRDTGLKKIPKELFWYIKPYDFNWCFAGTPLTVVKAEIFEKSDLSVLYSIECMFYCCEQIQYVEGKVFKNAVKLKEGERAFSQCVSLIEVKNNIFEGCASLESVGAMFYNNKSLVKVPTTLFEYQSGKYCPLNQITRHNFLANSKYQVPGAPNNQFELCCDTDGIFQYCESLTQCPDIWNAAKYPDIKMEIKDVQHQTARGWTEMHTKYINYFAFYGVNSIIANKIKAYNTNLYNKWVVQNIRVYFNYL